MLKKQSIQNGFAQTHIVHKVSETLTYGHNNINSGTEQNRTEAVMVSLQSITNCIILVLHEHNKR